MQIDRKLGAVIQDCRNPAKRCGPVRVSQSDGIKQAELGVCAEVAALLARVGPLSLKQIRERLVYPTETIRRCIKHQPTWFATEPAGLFLLNDGTDRLWVTEAYLDERRN